MPVEPTPYYPREVAPPEGSWLKRGLVAICVERRLPFRVAQAVDRSCNAVGLHRKTMRASGMRFRVRRQTCDEQFVHNIVEGSEYTPEGFEIGEEDVVIDIGGNIGTFTLLASRCASRGTVIAFEPDRDNHELLAENIRLNGATNVQAIRAAVTGDASIRSLRLYNSSEGGYHSVLEERMSNPSAFQEVDATTLPAIFEDYGIDRCNFLKLDCEGAEYDILHNLPQAYFDRIDKIAMEYHGGDDAQQRRKQSDELVAHLERMGFRVDAYEEFVGFRGGFIRAVRDSPAERDTV